MAAATRTYMIYVPDREQLGDKGLKLYDHATGAKEAKELAVEASKEYGMARMFLRIDHSKRGTSSDLIAVFENGERLDD